MSNFTFSVVNAGQRNSDVKPEIIATSTKGSFRLTGPAAEILGIAPGDYAMFVKGTGEDGSVAWFVGKGFAMKNSNGTIQTCKPIGIKAYIAENFDACLNKAMSEGDAELVDALSVEGISRDEQIELMANATTTTKYQGSKCASPSKQTGLGATVTFTDNNIWNQLKKDVDEPEKINRAFSLDVDNVVVASLPNGFDNVDVKLLMLGESVDAAPITRQ